MSFSPFFLLMGRAVAEGSDAELLLIGREVSEGSDFFLAAGDGGRRRASCGCPAGGPRRAGPARWSRPSEVEPADPGKVDPRVARAAKVHARVRRLTPVTSESLGERGAGVASNRRCRPAPSARSRAGIGLEGVDHARWRQLEVAVSTPHRPPARPDEPSRALAPARRSSSDGEGLRPSRSRSPGSRPSRSAACLAARRGRAGRRSRSCLWNRSSRGRAGRRNRSASCRGTASSR